MSRQGTYPSLLWPLRPGGFAWLARRLSGRLAAAAPGLLQPLALARRLATTQWAHRAPPGSPAGSTAQRAAWRVSVYADADTCHPHRRISTRKCGQTRAVVPRVACRRVGLQFVPRPWSGRKWVNSVSRSGWSWKRIATCSYTCAGKRVSSRGCATVERPAGCSLGRWSAAWRHASPSPGRPACAADHWPAAPTARPSAPAPAPPSRCLPIVLKCGQGDGGRRTWRAALARGRVRVSDLRSLPPRVVEGVQRQQLVAAVQLAGRRGVSAAVLPARS
jgi:hypothetical protein